MTSRRKIVVMGIMGRTPVAGVAWQMMHYLVGIHRLGHDVYYVEDTQTWPYNPETGRSDCEFTLKYIDRLMSWCDLKGRWAYVDVSRQGAVYGLSEVQLKDLLGSADVLINVTGSTELGEKHFGVPIRVYLETDPCAPQIQIAQGNRYTTDFLNAHTHHFTFGENLGARGCSLPVGPFNYKATRQPVVMDWWKPDLPADATARTSASFTTIGSWRQSNDIEWNGETYSWSKEKEFLRFIDLPQCCDEEFELALACEDTNALELLRSRGWRVIDAMALSRDIATYRDYVAGSVGEFTVAKDQNVRFRSGWFSDRSACYLAAGKPVITQDTGFGDVIPTGRGLFAFSDMEGILCALDAVRSDPEGNCRAARQIAEEYFDATKVMAKITSHIGL